LTLIPKEYVLIAAEYIGVIAVMMIAGLSPRLKQRRPVVFRYPMREGLVSLSLFAFILLVAFGIYVQFFTPIQANNLIWQRLIVAGIALIPFGVALLIRGQPMRSAGWPQGFAGFALRVAITLVFLVIFLSGKFLTLVKGLPSAQWVNLLAWVGIAISEETIFRGYIQPRIGAWLGENYGWLITSVLYGLWQVPHLLGNPTTLVIRLGLAVVQGLILGWVMRKSGHVLAPALYRAFSDWISLI
jgi:membrane protease YdiL (CAAX protease family)